MERAHKKCYAQLSTCKTPSDSLLEANAMATEKVKKQKKKKNVEKANKTKVKHHKVIEERIRGGIKE